MTPPDGDAGRGGERDDGWVRPPAVAGLFYPSTPGDLAAAVADHVGEVAAPAAGPDPDAVIAPHAGYRYSGATAGRAYRAVAGRRGRVERVVVAGPAHRVPVTGTGVGVSTARAWDTPLGEVEVDGATCRRLVAEGAAVEADAAHAPEHSIEVHLPFLIEVLGPVALVPLVVGRCPPRNVAGALARLWDDDTLVVVSSDLSHYLSDAVAHERDARTRDAIVEGRSGDVGPGDACGWVAVAGLMMAARDHGLAARTLGTATSAAASGDTGRVVGYASLAYAPPAPLTAEERAWLVARARRAIAHEAAHGAPDPLLDAEVPERLRVPGAAFVTLRRDGRLLGCIGSLEATRPLWRDVALNARAAAFADPRFPARPAREVAGTGVEIDVAVLSPLEPLRSPAVGPAGVDPLADALRPGEDGVLIEADGRRATFLPAVWETIPQPGEFVAALLDKAGLPTGTWPDGGRAWRYTTEVFTD